MKTLVFTLLLLSCAIGVSTTAPAHAGPSDSQRLLDQLIQPLEPVSTQGKIE
jgi:hypothetical protein